MHHAPAQGALAGLRETGAGYKNVPRVTEDEGTHNRLGTPLWYDEVIEDDIPASSPSPGP